MSARHSKISSFSPPPPKKTAAVPLPDKGFGTAAAYPFDYIRFSISSTIA